MPYLPKTTTENPPRPPTITCIPPSYMLAKSDAYISAYTGTARKAFHEATAFCRISNPIFCRNVSTLHNGEIF